MKKLLAFLKKETVLTVAWILAIISMFMVHPSTEYAGYIDFRTLGILWSLMVIMAGLKKSGVFDRTGGWLLGKTRKAWQLSMVLVMLCFFTSMFITNDVALITFVPFAMFTLEECDRKDLLIPVICLQTLAANLGSMLTPLGNPQNLYLYGLADLGFGEFVLLMLPYTALSFGLLLLSILLLKGKNEPVRRNVREGSIPDGRSSGHGKKGEIENRKKILFYALLFLLALLVVAHVMTYLILVLAVLVVVLIMDRKTLIEIDYALLFTFVGFFIFNGNLQQIPAFSSALAQTVNGHETIIGILASQIISNVPAALLLSSFSGNLKALIVGVNLGGLGTLIASMASLISYKQFAHRYNEKKGRYLLVFTLMNVIYLVILMLENLLIT